MNPFAAVTGSDSSGGPEKADFERIVHLCARVPWTSRYAALSTK